MINLQAASQEQSIPERRSSRETCTVEEHKTSGPRDTSVPALRQKQQANAWTHVQRKTFVAHVARHLQQDPARFNEVRRRIPCETVEQYTRKSKHAARRRNAPGYRRSGRWAGFFRCVSNGNAKSKTKASWGASRDSALLYPNKPCPRSTAMV